MEPAHRSSMGNPSSDQSESNIFRSQYSITMAEGDVNREAFVPPPDQEALALLSDQDLMDSSDPGINYVLVNLNSMPYIDCSDFRYRDARFAAGLSLPPDHAALSPPPDRAGLLEVP